MKKIILKSLVSTMALAALILTPASLSAQPGASLEGVWDSQVTNTDCNGNIFVAFRAFQAFHQGGTFTITGNLNHLPWAVPASGRGNARRACGRSIRPSSSSPSIPTVASPGP